MFEVTTIEEIDDPREIDADSYREAVEEFVEMAVNEGYWHDIAENGVVELKARRADREPEWPRYPWNRYRVTLNEETLKIKIARM